MKGIRFSSDEEELSLDYLYNIGLNHAKRGKPKDAIFYFDQVLKVDPTHVNALINKGNALGKIGRYEDAISIYDIVLNRDPRHVLSLLNKGLALHYLSRYGEAVACYDKIPPPQSAGPNVLYHKACSRALQKNITESLELH